MDFDALLVSHVGEWGRGQLLVLLAASTGWATLGVAVLSMVFVTQTPAWSCVAADDTLCHQQFLQQHHHPSALCRLTRDQFVWDRPHASLVSTFDLTCGNSWKTGWANAVFFIGYAIGSSLFGWLADTHGRKAGLLASSLSAACVTLLCAASSSYGMYVAGRLLQGLCCSGLPIAAYVLATESVGPTYRGRAGTGSQLLYHLGEWILPVMALLLQDWRLLYLAVSVLMVLTAALAAAVPESPRWQLLHGRQAQAVRTLAWLACLNGRQLPHNVIQQLQCGAVQDAKQPSPAHEDAPGAAPTAKGSKAAAGAAPAAVSAEPWHWQDSEVASLLAPANASQSLMQADCQKGHLQQHDQHSSHHQHQQQQQPQGQPSGSNHVPARHAGDTVWMVFWDPLLARLFWVSAWLCTVMAAAFFTTNLATEKLQGSLYVNFIVTSIGELPATVLGAVAVDAIGRRPTIGTGLLITGIACWTCSLLQPGAWSTALATLGKAACSSSWSLAYIYAAELMPTSVRSAALAGSNQAARLGGAVAPFFIYAADRLGHPKMPFALVGVLAAVTAAMTALLPETRGKPQPDSMADLRALYGSNSGQGAGDAGAPARVGGSFSDAGWEVKGGAGLVKRLLSEAASGGSWLLAARPGSQGSFSGPQWEPVAQREGSELQVVVTDVVRPEKGASLGSG